MFILLFIAIAYGSAFPITKLALNNSVPPILMASLSYDSNIGHVVTFKKPDAKIYGDLGVDIMNHEMETEILKRPEEYAWEYKKFRKLSSKPKDIYKD